MSHINIPPPRVCPGCGSEDLASVEVRAGPHRRQVCCRSCGKHVRWLPAPLTRDHALAFIMPFGKYKGMTLSDIIVVPDGPRYLQWLMGESRLTGRGLARKLRLALEGDPPARTPAAWDARR